MERGFLAEGSGWLKVQVNTQSEDKLPAEESGHACGGAPRRAFVALACFLVLSCVLENLSFLLGLLGWLPDSAVDLLALSAFALLGAATSFALYRLRSRRWLQGLMLAAIALLFLSQISDTLDELPALQGFAPLAKGHWLHELIEHVLFTLGCFALVAGALMAMVDGAFTANRLRLEGERLADTVKEREAAEHALQKVRDVLERMVEERTAELADRNEALQAELRERSKAEARLARRLRREEGLAACSNALLPKEKRTGLEVGTALAALRIAWDCERVLLYENREGPDGEMLMGLVYAIGDDPPEHWSVPNPQSCTAYADGCARWRTELSAGRPVGGPVASFPASEQASLAAMGGASVLLVPVAWQGAWRGFLAMVEEADTREWSSEEVRLLMTAAEMLQAYQERVAAETALRSAHEDLEARVQERTAKLALANRQLTEEVAFRKRMEEDNERLESRLRGAQKFEAIATLAGGVAHDFNNILSAINGFAELGASRVEDANLRRYFDEILRSAARAAELVRRLLVFGRKVEHQPVPVVLTEVVREACAQLRHDLPSHITLQASTEAVVRPVAADPDQIREVVMILCENARDFLGAKGGHIELRVDQTELYRPLPTSCGVLTPGEYVRVTVQDDGPGIPEDVQDRIFEPFYTTRGVGEGSGMGLATVLGFVSKHHGGIRLDSKEGLGASFQVFLPVCASDGQVRGGIAPVGGTEHILVVDDEAHLVALWEETLQRYGFRTTGVNDSVEALGIFERDPESFDLVLLDHVMPNMRGTELAERILSIRPDVPVIMATGFSESVAEESARAMGIRDFILKPIVGSELAAAVRKALSERARS